MCDRPRKSVGTLAKHKAPPPHHYHDVPETGRFVWPQVGGRGRRRRTNMVVQKGPRICTGRVPKVESERSRLSHVAGLQTCRAQEGDRRTQLGAFRSLSRIPFGGSEP